MRPRPRPLAGLGPLEVVAICGGVVALAGTLAAEIGGGVIRIGGGCGVDGGYYCEMAAGQLAAEPFSRRVLAPFLIHLTAPKDVGVIVTRFQLLDALSLVAVCALAGWLTWQVARGRGASGRRSAAAVAVVVAFLVVAPMSFRWSRWYPVLVDDTALALATAWMAAFLSRSRAANLLSLPLAAAAILTRESWVLPITVTALASLAGRRSPFAGWLTGLTVVIAGLVALAAYRMPYTHPFLPPITTYVPQVLAVRFKDGAATAATTWAAALGSGLIPLVLLHPAAWRRRAVPRAAPFLAMGLANVVLALIGGNDVQRYVFAGLPFVLSLALGSVAAAPKLDWWLAPLAAATLVLWRPFQLAVHDDSLFVPQYYANVLGRIETDLVLVAAALVVTAAIALVLRALTKPARLAAAPSILNMRR